MAGYMSPERDRAIRREIALMLANELPGSPGSPGMPTAGAEGMPPTGRAPQGGEPDDMIRDLARTLAGGLAGSIVEMPGRRWDAEQRRGEEDRQRTFAREMAGSEWNRQQQRDQAERDFQTKQGETQFGRQKDLITHEMQQQQNARTPDWKEAMITQAAIRGDADALAELTGRPMNPGERKAMARQRGEHARSQAKALTDNLNPAAPETVLQIPQLLYQLERGGMQREAQQLGQQVWQWLQENDLADGELGDEFHRRAFGRPAEQPRGFIRKAADWLQGQAPGAEKRVRQSGY